MTNPGMWTPLIAAQQTRVNYIDDVNRGIDTYLKQTADQQKKDNEKTGTTAIAVAALIGITIVMVAR